MTRLDDIAKQAGERGLVRGTEDGRSRANEGIGDVGDPTNVEQFKGNSGSVHIATHSPYVNAANNGATHSPTAHAQVASLDANITTNYHLGAGAVQPPSGSGFTYSGNSSSPHIERQLPYISNVISSTSGIHPGTGASIGAEAYTGFHGDTNFPLPPSSGDIETYTGNPSSPSLASHFEYVNKVNDGAGNHGAPADHSS